MWIQYIAILTLLAKNISNSISCNNFMISFAKFAYYIPGSQNADISPSSHIILRCISDSFPSVFLVHPSPFLLSFIGSNLIISIFFNLSPSSFISLLGILLCKCGIISTWHVIISTKLPMVSHLFISSYLNIYGCYKWKSS